MFGIWGAQNFADELFILLLEDSMQVQILEDSQLDNQILEDNQYSV